MSNDNFNKKKTKTKKKVYINIYNVFILPTDKSSGHKKKRN